MPAVAFQTLYFEKGSEQSLHQDTAFVYVNEPQEFLATWIALEDVKDGAGELIYYPASHKLPEKLFAGGTEALLPNDPHSSSYSADLVSRCTQAGLAERRFLPKKGDVLFWAADLAHAGAPRATSDTRRRTIWRPKIKAEPASQRLSNCFVLCLHSASRQRDTERAL